MAKDQEFPEILSKQESVNIQKAEPGAPPSDPKPAATVLLVRAPENEIEVFMIKRNSQIVESEVMKPRKINLLTSS